MCLGLFSCGADDTPKGMQLASNTKVVDYKLFVPESWVVSEAERATSQAFASATDRTNVLVMQWNIDNPEVKTVQDWWEKKYKPEVIDAEVLKDVKIANDKGTFVTLDKVAAVKYTYVGKMGDFYYTYDVIAAIRKGSVYIMQFTYRQDAKLGENNELVPVEENGAPVFSSIEENKEAIESIISNFKWLK